MSKQKQRKQQRKEEQEQEEVWKEIFNLFDKDGNGHICREELAHVLRALDMDPTQQELEDAVAELDKDGNGVIEFADFHSYMMKMNKSTYEERKQEMLTAFRIIDKNNDKFIDVHELMSVLTCLGEPLTEEEVKAMIRVADVNRDGKIDYEEFVEFILSPCLQPKESTVKSYNSSNVASSSFPCYNSRKKNETKTMSSQETSGFFFTADIHKSSSTVPGGIKQEVNEGDMCAPVRTTTAWVADENDNLPYPEANKSEHYDAEGKLVPHSAAQVQMMDSDIEMETR